MAPRRAPRCPSGSSSDGSTNSVVVGNVGAPAAAAAPPRRSRSIVAPAAGTAALFLLLLLLSLAAAPARAQPPAALTLPATRTSPLSSASPGCGAADLGPNLDECVVEASIEKGLVHEYTFSVPPRGGDTPFSVLLTAKSVGGHVEMYALGPSRMFTYNTIFRLVGEDTGNTAMSESFIRVRGGDLEPGQWRVRVFAQATDRKAILYTVRVQTPPTSTRLVAPEKTALAQLVSDCCDVRKAMALGAPNVQLCAAILPAAAAAKTNATTDICQVGPFMCTPQGRLQKLMLGGAGLSCPKFPASIGKFEELHTVELEIAEFGGDTFANAAKALAPLKALERLYLRDTDLKGALPCALVEGKSPGLKVLDLSDTEASGALPGCFLAVRDRERERWRGPSLFPCSSAVCFRGAVCLGSAHLQP